MTAEPDVHRLLAAEHPALVTAIAAVLNLELGLREATTSDPYGDLLHDLHNALAIETGLTAIVNHGRSLTTPDTGHDSYRHRGRERRTRSRRDQLRGPDTRQ